MWIIVLKKYTILNLNGSLMLSYMHIFSDQEYPTNSFIQLSCTLSNFKSRYIAAESLINNSCFWAISDNIKKYSKFNFIILRTKTSASWQDHAALHCPQSVEVEFRGGYYLLYVRLPALTRTWPCFSILFDYLYRHVAFIHFGSRKYVFYMLFRHDNATRQDNAFWLSTVRFGRKSDTFHSASSPITRDGNLANASVRPISCLKYFFYYFNIKKLKRVN